MVFKNRIAYYHYEVVDTYTAGIVLKGAEVKAMRDGKLSLVNSYCAFVNGELYLKQAEITMDGKLNYDKLPSTRDRKLLLNKRELQILQSKVATKGLTIVPLKVYTNENNLFKVEVALARGKKLYDRRNAIKDRDLKRQSDL